MFLINRIITSLADILCLIKSLALNVSGSTGSAQKDYHSGGVKYENRRNITNCCEQISSNGDLLPSTIDVLPNNLLNV